MTGSWPEITTVSCVLSCPTLKQLRQAMETTTIDFSFGLGVAEARQLLAVVVTVCFTVEFASNLKEMPFIHLGNTEMHVTRSAGFLL